MEYHLAYNLNKPNVSKFNKNFNSNEIFENNFM